ncbi:Glutamine cyclotransferase [Entamoeba marina]
MFINYSSDIHTVELTKILPHDKECYTQGLLVRDNTLYESCGMYGKSILYKYDFDTLTMQQSVSLRKELFAEGIAIVNETLVLLTWREHLIQTYNPNTLEIIDEHTYDYHGWGAAEYLNSLYVTDGSNKVRQLIVNDGIQIINEFFVKRGNAFVSRLNDFDVINNTLWMNIYYEDKIIVVDRFTGVVIGEVWCNVKRIGKEEVMNGIAMLPSGDVLLTGKYWDSMFVLHIN